MRLSILGVRIPEGILRVPFALCTAAVLVAVLVTLEWGLNLEYSLGIFYAIPVAMAGLALNRWQIFTFAILCAFLRGLFTPEREPLDIVLRFVMAVFAYAGVGLLIVEMSRNRRVVMSHYANLKIEQELRRRAEEQLRLLADSSPAAILTLNNYGEVIAANRAAREVFGIPTGSQLVGMSIGSFVSTLASAIQLTGHGGGQVRTSAWTWAKRIDGSMFPIATWFSTYGEGHNRHLAAIVVDVTEEVRDREMENFRHVLDYNRLLAGTVSHEIRNLCSAVAVVSSNMRRRPEIAANEDFQALNQLISGLSRLASFELQTRKNESHKYTQLGFVLNNLRIIAEPDWREIDGELKWEQPDDLPIVHGEDHGLLQVFLNLIQNSLRAMNGCPVRKLTVKVEKREEDVVVQFHDSGPGVTSPETLFHPFHAEASGSGLGLYISRALVRSFGGDLEYIPGSTGCLFEVLLKVRRQAEIAEQRE